MESVLVLEGYCDLYFQVRSSLKDEDERIKVGFFITSVRIVCFLF